MKLNSAKLIDARNRRGLLQAEVRAQTGISEATISAAENGKSVSRDTGICLANFYGLALADIVVAEENAIA